MHKLKSINNFQHRGKNIFVVESPIYWAPGKMSFSEAMGNIVEIDGKEWRVDDLEVEVPQPRDERRGITFDIYEPDRIYEAHPRNQIMISVVESTGVKNEL